MMTHSQNDVLLEGYPASSPEWSHENHGTQFYRFLNDQLHFVCLRKPLKEIHLCRQFHIILLNKSQLADYFIRQKLCDFAAVLSSVYTITDSYFFTDFHPEHIFYVIYIFSCDDDSIPTDLSFFHKELIHTLTPTINSSATSTPILSTPTSPILPARPGTNN